jgi:hypothetical protein
MNPNMIRSNDVEQLPDQSKGADRRNAKPWKNKKRGPFPHLAPYVLQMRTLAGDETNVARKTREKRSCKLAVDYDKTLYLPKMHKSTRLVSVNDKPTNMS